MRAIVLPLLLAACFAPSGSGGTSGGDSTTTGPGPESSTSSTGPDPTTEIGTSTSGPPVLTTASSTGSTGSISTTIEPPASTSTTSEPSTGGSTGSTTGSERARLVFLTSGIWTGSQIGGLDSGDAICNAAAAAPIAAPTLVGRTFVAWLSGQQVDMATRLSPWTGPYERLDGVLVAEGNDGLLAGELLAPIDVMETGETAPDAGNCERDFGGGVWTGTFKDGSGDLTKTCMTWSVGTGEGRFGHYADTGFGWTSCSTTLCALSLRLYCIEV